MNKDFDKLYKKDKEDPAWWKWVLVTIFFIIFLALIIPIHIIFYEPNYRSLGWIK